MIKTILVPATGNDRDDAVFAAALSVARRFAAHLEFLHVRADAAAALAVSMAADGSGATMVGSLMNQLEQEAAVREEKAEQLFRSFCEREALPVHDMPPGAGPSAQWLREIGTEPQWIVEHGRAADLLVIGRPGDEGASLDMLETALLECGRPLLLPPAAPLQAVPETIAIAWKNTPEAARALTGALPFVSIAKEIVILTVAEDQSSPQSEADRLAAALGWRGAPVSIRRLQGDGRAAADTLLLAAAEHSALLVMGGYGHSRLREWIFGGFTLRVLRDAEVPVLMMH